MKKVLFITLIALSVACGDEAAPSEGQENPAGAVSTANATEKSPCDLVDEAEIRTLFAIPENEPTEIKDQMLTYPTCSYTWESVTYPQTKTLGGNEVTIDYPTEMMIVLVKNSTEKMFETSTKVYKDGEVQNGIGEKAMWGDKMSQLTFLSKGYMVHLHVKKSGDAAENKALATKISALIIKKL